MLCYVDLVGGSHPRCWLTAAAVFSLPTFISDPLLIGFQLVRLVIVVDQIPKLLFLHLQKATFVPICLASFGGPLEHRRLLWSLTCDDAFLVGNRTVFPAVPAPLVAVAMGLLARALFSGCSPMACR